MRLPCIDSLYTFCSKNEDVLPINGSRVGPGRVLIVWEDTNKWKFWRRQVIIHIIHKLNFFITFYILLYFFFLILCLYFVFLYFVYILFRKPMMWNSISLCGRGRMERAMKPLLKLFFYYMTFITFFYYDKMVLLYSAMRCQHRDLLRKVAIKCFYIIDWFACEYAFPHKQILNSCR